MIYGTALERPSPTKYPTPSVAGLPACGLLYIKSLASPVPVAWHNVLRHTDAMLGFVDSIATGYLAWNVAKGRRRGLSVELPRLVGVTLALATGRACSVRCCWKRDAVEL